MPKEFNDSWIVARALSNGKILAKGESLVNVSVYVGPDLATVKAYLSKALVNGGTCGYGTVREVKQCATMQWVEDGGNTGHCQMTITDLAKLTNVLSKHENF